MAKSISIFAALFLFYGIGNAQNQSISPQSINSAGTKMSQTNGSLTFTVGELVVLSQTDNDGNTLGGGFSAGATLTTLNVSTPNKNVLIVNVFPNPTAELVNVQINHSTIDQVFISISDIQGKEVYNGKYAGISNTIGINTASYPTCNYTLSLKDKNNQVLGTYKIIKR